MDALEDGQIKEETITGQHHNPSYEWPGDDDPGSDALSEDYLREPLNSKETLRPGQPIFRLVVLRSSILPKRQRVAIIDAYVEAQIGRDAQLPASVTPRIRLKEMEVSKLHATAFWDAARKEWSVVDMGSKHGTFVRASPISPDSIEGGSRLSQPRTASIPRRLRHNDQLRIGGTTFVVHIHDNQRPCDECSISGKEEIPLFPSPRKTSVKRTSEAAGFDSDSSGSSRAAPLERDPKKALSMLKHSLLPRHDGSTTGTASSEGETAEYIDRAARRRFLHPSSRPDTPGIPSLPSMIPKTTLPISITREYETKPVVSQLPVPLPSTNIGHRLLMQQGWAPGNSLGASSDAPDSEERTGLVEPLELKSSRNRLGLGMKQGPVSPEPSLSSGLNWKETEKFRRFESQR